VLAIAVSAFSAVVATVQIHSVESQRPTGLLLGFYVAMPFLLISVSFLAILTLYMLGRTLYWSYMAMEAMSVSPRLASKSPSERQETTTTLVSMTISASKRVQETHHFIFLFWCPLGIRKFIYWLGFAAILSLTLLTAFRYLPQWIPAYLVLIAIITILEVRYWTRLYSQIYN